MTFKQKLSVAMAYAGISQAELARRLGTAPQYLNSKLKTGKYSQQELQKIGKALGIQIEIVFKLPNGTTI